MLAFPCLDAQKFGHALKLINMITYTLITGASSGIGEAIAHALATKRTNLILTARNTAKLQQLQQEIQRQTGVRVEVVDQDLSTPEGAENLFDYVEERKWVVDTLINNAGVGLYGPFENLELQQEQAMIQLNVISLVTLSKLFGKRMIEQGNGTILNVASLLSYLPFPYYTTYSATKSFVMAFSETLGAEWKPKGVRVCALFPGPTDTAFTTADMLATHGYAANPPTSAAAVATAAVALLQSRSPRRIVGFGNWFLSNLPRITPDNLMTRIKHHLASPKNSKTG